MRNDQTPLQQIAWTAACRLGEFDYRALAAEAEIGYETVGTWVRRWERLGKVERLGKQDGNTQRFRVAEIDHSAPVQKLIKGQTGTGNMWRSMRHLRKAFTPTDVAAHATTDVVGVSAAEAQLYCQMLARAGYLRVVRKALPPRREAVYQLIKDTGPRPPRERRVRVVWDDNLAEISHMPGDQA